MKDPSLNNDKQAINKLTVDMLKKYQRGELTGREMHQVERMLLEDPFAAEALEGMVEIDSEESWESIVSALNQQIDNRISREKQKIVPIYRRPRSIAAAVALLLVASFLVFNIADWVNTGAPDSEGPIALEKSSTPEPPEKDDEQKSPEPEEKPALITESDTGVLQEQQQYEQQPDRQEIARSLENELTAPQKTALSDAENKVLNTKNDSEIAVSEEIDIAVGADEAEISEELAKEVQAKPEAARKKQNEATIAGKQEEGAFSKTDKKRAQPTVTQSPSRLKQRPATQKTISGQVISADDGRGIPGVSLYFKGGNRGTTTDVEGNYELQVTENDAVLVCNFIGYVTEEILIQDQERIDIMLEPEKMALQEIVVVGNVNDSDEAFIPVVSARPEVKKQDYQRYLYENLRYPADALKNKIEGRVKVTFFVLPGGRLSDFQVKKSLGYGCDEEAIRLIREGPRWQPARKGEMEIKQKVRVRVRFEIKNE